ncbi:MAG TPA: hypothetical protein VJV05_07715 [Pyrinomonadaceae bacterium]|nr:hypothetical protein [Pyrinomonadaceae bacterium]
MHTSRFRLVGLILALCFLGSCSGNAGNTNTQVNGNSGNATGASNNASQSDAKAEYPEGVKDEFLKSCVKAGSDAKFCACVFDKVKSKYSFEEFSVIESKINAGTAPDDFVEFSGKARAECAKNK